MLNRLKQFFKRRRSETISGVPLSFGYVFRSKWPDAKRSRLYELLTDPVMLEAMGTLQVRASTNVRASADAPSAIAENNRLRGYNQFPSDLLELTRTTTESVELSEWAHITDEPYHE